MELTPSPPARPGRLDMARLDIALALMGLLLVLQGLATATALESNGELPRVPTPTRRQGRAQRGLRWAQDPALSDRRRCRGGRPLPGVPEAV